MESWTLEEAGWAWALAWNEHVARKMYRDERNAIEWIDLGGEA